MTRFFADAVCWLFFTAMLIVCLPLAVILAVSLADVEGRSLNASRER